MEHQSCTTKAASMYERAMDEVHGHINDAKESVEDLSLFLDGIENRLSDEEVERIEDLISKAIISLCKI